VLVKQRPSSPLLAGEWPGLTPRPFVYLPGSRNSRCFAIPRTMASCLVSASRSGGSNIHIPLKSHTQYPHVPLRRLFTTPKGVRRWRWASRRKCPPPGILGPMRTPGISPSAGSSTMTHHATQVPSTHQHGGDYKQGPEHAAHRPAHAITSASSAATLPLTWTTTLPSESTPTAS